MELISEFISKSRGRTNQKQDKSIKMEFAN